jgi:hypothetical protein
MVTGNYLVKATYEGDEGNLGTSETVNFAVAQFTDRNVFSVTSNSTVTSIAFNSESHELRFTVTGESTTTGYADVYVSKSIIADIANVKAYLDGSQIQYTATQANDFWQLHFSYHHSSHEVTVRLGLPPPEPVLGNPLAIALIIGGILSLPLAMAFLFARRRSSKRKSESLTTKQVQ